MKNLILTITNKKNLLFTKNLKNIYLKRGLREIFYVDLFFLIKTSFLRYKSETPEIIGTIFKTEKYFIKNVSGLYNPHQLFYTSYVLKDLFCSIFFFFGIETIHTKSDFYTHTTNVLMSNCSTNHVLCYPLMQHVFVSILGFLPVPIGFLNSTTKKNNLFFFDYYNLILERNPEDIKKIYFSYKNNKNIYKRLIKCKKYVYV